MDFKTRAGTLPLDVSVDYNTYLGRVEIEDIFVCLESDTERHNIAHILDPKLMMEIQDEFYRQIPDAPLDEET